jgi:subtilisin family serine protease
VRRFTFWLSLSLLVAVVFPFATHGRLQTDAEPADAATVKPTRAEFVPGSVLVRFRSDEAAKLAERTATALQLPDATQAPMRVERFEGSDLLPGLRHVHVTAADTLQAVAALNARPDVLYAEPDYIRRKSAVPNDPRYAEMYSLNNTGQSGGTVGVDIRAEQAWNTTQGSRNIVVGIVDEGFDINHPDLRDNVWTNPSDDADAGFPGDTHGWDFVHNDASVFDNTSGVYPAPDSYNGDIDDHGTHVAGTIGATGNNGLGVAGINWQVSLMSIKVLGRSGGSDSDIIRGYAYAKMMRERWESSNHTRGANIRVLNNSYGGGGFSQTALDAIRALNNAGILFVVAAGNGGADHIGDNNDRLPEYPANFDAPNVISVASTDRFDSRSSFSNFGARTVALGAPGSQILSTTPFSTYSTFSGTSMATPHVAGAAALLCAANPNLSVAQLRGLLLYSGDVTTAMTGITSSNRRLSLGKAVQALSDTTPPGQITGLNVGDITGPAAGRRALNVSWAQTGDDGDTGSRPALYEVIFEDTTTGARLPLGNVLPTLSTAAGGTFSLPYRHASGLVKVRAIDKAGNVGPEASVAVTRNAVSVDPYVVTTGAAAPLSTGGTPLALRADDRYLENYQLPFSFPFYEQGSTTFLTQQFTTVTISTNGALYFGFTAPPKRTNGDADDLPSNLVDLNSRFMIAGLWDDLRTDRTGGDVYVTAASDRVIFRWQAVTFSLLPNGISRGENPVNFEIELRSDGTIITRYGNGNNNLVPVVGISGGEPEAYVATTHTRPLDDPQGGLINLTNAQSVTFTPRTVVTAAATVQFVASAVSVSEGARAVTLTVSRTGSGTGTVNVQTLDDPAEVPCNAVNATAFARCDYATTIDTLSFAASDSNKTITIPIIDDGYTENSETFQVALLAPTGGLVLGTPATVTVTVLNNDTAATPNPIFQTPFFVRQHYLDFLAREPEANEPWSAVLNGCSDVNNNPACDRLTVSGSFFGSPEFLTKGVYTIVFYRAAFNRLPTYAEFAQDLRSVTGTTAAETNTKRATFAVSFTQRQEFTGQYNGLSNSAYVAALMGRYQLTQITTPDPANPDGTQRVTLTQANLVSQLDAGTLTRAQVLRAIVQSSEVSQQREATNAFVASQYYGYLRRAPETAGFNSWVNYLATHPGDFRTMVNGFMNSTEYRLRFGTAQ